MAITPPRVERAELDVPDPESPLARAQRVLAEGALPFNEACDAARIPRQPYPVMNREHHRGNLECVKIGGRILTSGPAVLRWLARINQRTEPTPRTAPRGRRSKRRPTTSAAAKAYLRARGLPTGEEGV